MGAKTKHFTKKNSVKKGPDSLDAFWRAMHQNLPLKLTLEKLGEQEVMITGVLRKKSATFQVQGRLRDEPEMTFSVRVKEIRKLEYGPLLFDQGWQRW